MLVILSTAKGSIAVNADAVRSVVPNKADSACTVFFDEQHGVEVIGSLAKIRSKLNETTPKGGDAAAKVNDAAPKAKVPSAGFPARR